MTPNTKPQPAGKPAAADFDRPLLLTPGQDLVGFSSRLVGRGFLTSVASLTILAVFLIFFYILRMAWPFFASHGVRVVTHPDVPVKSLTVAQARDIYRGKITNWKEVGGPDVAIVPISYDRHADAFESFYKLVIKGDSRGKRVELGKDVKCLATDSMVVEAVQATRGAVAFVDLAYKPGAELRGISVGGEKELTRRSASELFRSDKWFPTQEGGERSFGALGSLYGSGMVTAGAMLFAVPLGLLAALFLSDIVPFGLRQVIKPIIEILAAIPSVAFGFFAFLVIAPWMQNTLGFTTGVNMLNASVILAIMAIPTIVSISEDALGAIGRDMREGAYALGATRAEVLTKVVIPAAHSGIIAAIILGIMRAVGETMLVWMAAGNATGVPTPWWNLAASIRTLTATIAAEMGEAPAGGVHRQSLFALGVILLVLTFVLNLVSEYFLARAKRAITGTKK